MLKQLETIVRRIGTTVVTASELSVTEKEGHANFVTDMDVRVQRMLMEELNALLPEADFICEEKENEKLSDKATWIVDPIDGTTNLIHDYRQSAISVALMRNREPVLACVYNPFTDEVFSAEKGQGAWLDGKRLSVSQRPLDKALIGFGTAPYYEELSRATMRIVYRLLHEAGDVRRSGSAALDLAYVACGRTDAFFELRLKPWDVAAGALLVAEAGGVFTMPLNEKVDFDLSTAVVASNAECLEGLCQMVLEEAAGESA